MLQRKLGRVAAGPLVPPQISSVLKQEGAQSQRQENGGEIEKKPRRFDSTGVVFLTTTITTETLELKRLEVRQQSTVWAKPLIQWVFLCFHDYLHWRLITMNEHI